MGKSQVAGAQVHMWSPPHAVPFCSVYINIEVCTVTIDVQYTRALYSLSNRLRLACNIRKQTYIAASNVFFFLVRGFHPPQYV